MGKVLAPLRLFPLTLFLCLLAGSLKGEAPSGMNALSPLSVTRTGKGNEIVEGGRPNLKHMNYYGPLLDAFRAPYPKEVPKFSEVLTLSQHYFGFWQFLEQKAPGTFPVAEHTKLFGGISENLRRFFLNVLRQAGAQLPLAEMQALEAYVSQNHFGVPTPGVPSDETVLRIAAKLKDRFPFAKQVELKMFPGTPKELFFVLKVQNPDQPKDPSSQVELVIPFSNRSLQEFLDAFYVSELPDPLKSARNHHVLGNFFVKNDNRFAFFIPLSLPIFLKDQGLLEDFLLGVYLQHVLINSFFYSADGRATVQPFVTKMESQQSAYAKTKGLKPGEYAFQETNAASLEKSVLAILQGFMPSPCSISYFHDITKISTIALSLIDSRIARIIVHEESFNLHIIDSFLYTQARLVAEGKKDSIDVWSNYRETFTFKWDPDPIIQNGIRKDSAERARFEKEKLLPPEQFDPRVNEMLNDPALKDIYGQVGARIEGSGKDRKVIFYKISGKPGLSSPTSSGTLGHSA